MATSAGVVFIQVLPNMEAFAAELDASVSTAAAGAGEAAGAAASAGAATGAQAGLAGSTSKFGGMGTLLGVAFVAMFAKASIGAGEAVDKQVLRIEDSFRRLGLEGLGAGAVDALKAVSAQTVTLQADTLKLGANIFATGHTYFAGLGAAAGPVLAGLTKGILNISAATGKPIAMLQRSLTLAVVNTPDKAVPALQKLGVITAAQAAKFTALAKSGDLVSLRQQEINAITAAYPNAAGNAATAGDKFKKTLNDIEVFVGGKLIPVFNFLASLLSTQVGKAILGVVVVGAALLVSLSLISKAVAFLGNNVLVKYIKSLIAKRAAMVADTVATDTAAVSTDALAGSEAVAGTATAALSVEEELNAIQAANMAAATDAAAASNLAFSGTTVLAVAGAAALGFAIGTAINKLTGLSEKFNNLLDSAMGWGDNLKNVGQSTDDQVAKQVALEKQYASGAITQQQFSDGVAAINKEFGTSISETYLLNQATADHAALQAAAAKAAAYHAAQVKIATTALDGFNLMIGKNVTTLADAKQAYIDWGANAASQMNFVVGSLQGLTSQAHITAKGVAKSLDAQAKNMKSFGNNLDKIASDGTAGATELVNQLIAAGPAGQHMAAVIAGATPKVRQHIENDIGKSLTDSTNQASTLEKTLTGGMDHIAAAMLVATGKATDFKTALDQINATNVDVPINVTYHQHGTGGGPPPHHAAGGPVTPFQTYLVGERGPELFRSDVAGSIVPNDKLSEASVGGGGGRKPVQLVLSDGSTFNAYIEELVTGMSA